MTEKGLTLLEVMITLAILATLMAFSNQSIQNAIKSKLKIQDQVDSMGRLRDALRVIEKDVNLAFHYRDIESEMNEEIRKAQKPAGGAGQPGYPQQQNKPNRVDPTTHFQGTSESMVFPSMNSGRMNEGARQADFIKVGYSLRGCKKLNAKDSSGQCLIRSTSPVVEGDLTKVPGDDSVLLDNVTEFKLRYIGKGKQDWNGDWDSKSQDNATKGNFPQAVEVSITIEVPDNKGKTKKYSMQIVANIHFLNNRIDANSGQTPVVGGP